MIILLSEYWHLFSESIWSLLHRELTVNWVRNYYHFSPNYISSSFAEQLVSASFAEDLAYNLYLDASLSRSLDREFSHWSIQSHGCYEVICDSLQIVRNSQFCRLAIPGLQPLLFVAVFLTVGLRAFRPSTEISTSACWRHRTQPDNCQTPKPS